MVSQSSPNPIPAACADWGSRLVAVNPGSVFASRQSGVPSSCTLKSTREKSLSFSAL
jgi:hypothetical protein